METAILRVVLGLTGLFILWVRETDAWKLYKRITKWQRRALLKEILMLPSENENKREDEKMKELYQFSLAAQDESARARIRAVKEKYGEYGKHLDQSARILGLFTKRNIPEMSQLLARGYYLILDAAGWDAKHEECGF